MLSRPYRLPAGEMFANSQSIFTAFFRILIKPNNLSHHRFGFVVSKKIDKRAVVRNRLKRVLREAVKDLPEEEVGKDVLFIVKKSFVDEPTATIIRLVYSTLKNQL